MFLKARICSRLHQRIAPSSRSTSEIFQVFARMEKAFPFDRINFWNVKVESLAKWKALRLQVQPPYH